jgi:hypothetical protein
LTTIEEAKAKRQNIDTISELTFKTESFKTINTKFKKLYEILKTKNFTITQKSTLKLSINNIVKGLKDLEDGKPKNDVSKSIKENVKNIVVILKTLKN